MRGPTGDAEAARAKRACAGPTRGVCFAVGSGLLLARATLDRADAQPTFLVRDPRSPALELELARCRETGTAPEAATGAGREEAS